MAATTATTSAPGPAPAPANPDAWDRRSTSAPGINGESINLRHTVDDFRAAITEGTTTVLRDSRIAGSTEVRVENATVRGENWGGDISGSKLINVDFYNTNFKGGVLFSATLTEVNCHSGCEGEGLSVIRSRIQGSDLSGLGKVASLRESAISLDSKLKDMDLRSTDMRGLKFLDAAGNALTPAQMFAALERDLGEAGALKVFRKMFNGTIYDRNSPLIDKELRDIFDKISHNIKAGRETSIGSKDALFNELDSNPHFANSRDGVSKRTRTADGYTIDLEDRDSPARAKIEVVTVPGLTAGTERFVIKYKFDDMDDRFLKARGWNPDGTVVPGSAAAALTIGSLNGIEALTRALSIVREAERQFQRRSGVSRQIDGGPDDAEPGAAGAGGAGAGAVGGGGPGEGGGAPASGAPDAASPDASREAGAGDGDARIADPAAGAEEDARRIEDTGAAAGEAAGSSDGERGAARRDPAEGPAREGEGQAAAGLPHGGEPSPVEQRIMGLREEVRSALAEYDLTHQGSELDRELKDKCEEAFVGIIDPVTGELRAAEVRILENYLRPGAERRLTPGAEPIPEEQKAFFRDLLARLQTQFGPAAGGGVLAATEDKAAAA